MEYINTSILLKLSILLKIIQTNSGQIMKYYITRTQIFMASGTLVLYNKVIILCIYDHRYSKVISRIQRPLLAC